MQPRKGEQLPVLHQSRAELRHEDTGLEVHALPTTAERRSLRPTCRSLLVWVFRSFSSFALYRRFYALLYSGRSLRIQTSSLALVGQEFWLSRRLRGGHLSLDIATRLTSFRVRGWAWACSLAPASSSKEAAQRRRPRPNSLG